MKQKIISHNNLDVILVSKLHSKLETFQFTLIFTNDKLTKLKVFSFIFLHSLRGEIDQFHHFIVGELTG